MNIISKHDFSIRVNLKLGDIPTLSKRPVCITSLTNKPFYMKGMTFNHFLSMFKFQVD